MVLDNAVITLSQQRVHELISDLVFCMHCFCSLQPVCLCLHHFEGDNPDDSGCGLVGDQPIDDAVGAQQDVQMHDLESSSQSAQFNSQPDIVNSNGVFISTDFLCISEVTKMCFFRECKECAITAHCFPHHGDGR